MAHIWIVEDDLNIALLIEMAMKKAGHSTLKLADAVKLDQALKTTGRVPDLLLLDLMLRAKSGFEILEEWKVDPRLCEIPVIIISARSAEKDKVRGLELGAEDYITKPFGVLELQARVKTALRRVRLKSDVLQAGDLSFLPATREASLGGKHLDLTAMEFDLLYYLARNRGKNVTRASLLTDVWGYSVPEDPSRTLDAHIKTLRIKLGDDAASPRFIQTVRGTGYRFIAGEEN